MTTKTCSKYALGGVLTFNIAEAKTASKKVSRAQSNRRLNFCLKWPKLASGLFFSLFELARNHSQHSLTRLLGVYKDRKRFIEHYNTKRYGGKVTVWLKSGNV